MKSDEFVSDVIDEGRGHAPRNIEKRPCSCVLGLLCIFCMRPLVRCSLSLLSQLLGLDGNYLDNDDNGCRLYYILLSRGRSVEDDYSQE